MTFLYLRCVKKTKLYLIIILSFITFLFQPVIAQNQLKIGTDIPLQYGIGYKYTSTHGLGGGLKIGVLTEPHNSIILSIIQALGTKEAIVNIIRESFKMGVIIDGSGSWNWNKNYVGANLVLINLSAGEAPLSAIDSQYNFDIFSYWNPLSSIFSQESMQISLNSTLMQLGIHYGRRIPLKEKLELQLEFGLSKNLGSSNIFSSDFPYPESIFNTMDEDLQRTYQKYAIIPTIGIYLVYTI